MYTPLILASATDTPDCALVAPSPATRQPLLSAHLHRSCHYSTQQALQQQSTPTGFKQHSWSHSKPSPWVNTTQLHSSHRVVLALRWVLTSKPAPADACLSQPPPIHVATGSGYHLPRPDRTLHHISLHADHWRSITFDGREEEGSAVHVQFQKDIAQLFRPHTTPDTKPTLLSRWQCWHPHRSLGSTWVWCLLPHSTPSPERSQCR